MLLLYSETTPGAMFDNVLELTAALNRGLFKLFQHPSLAIVKAAGLIMKAIIEVSYTYKHVYMFLCCVESLS